MSSGAGLYKRLIKELLQHHRYAAAGQTKVVQAADHARNVLAQRAGGTSTATTYEAKPLDVERVRRQFELHEISEADAHEVVEFLTHQRQYKELLDRYTVGPSDTLDRVRMTARRVGLNADEL